MEIWRDIPGYEGLYRVSNLGRVKSLTHSVKCRIGYRIVIGKMLSQCIANTYYSVALSKKSKHVNYKVHQLVAIAFLNHVPCGSKLVVDHKDYNPLNNRLYNIQVITQRENLSKDKKGSSKYTGVSWHKIQKSWASSIRINGKRHYLGYFKNEYDAHLAYQKALRTVV